MRTISKKLNKEEIEAFGKEVDTLREEVMAKVGKEDADHIRFIYKTYRYTEVLGRGLIHFSFEPISFVAGTLLLSISKIINNMELGHNVLHGQYDWMNDPRFNSRTFEWDIVCNAHQWKFYHNYMHHTYTNVLNKDHDYGYNFTRLTEAQKWKPVHLTQPFTNMFLAMNFQWGIGAHGYRVEYLETPKKLRKKKTLKDYKELFFKKIELQLLKDYILFPALAGLNFPKVILGNLLANLIRNLWTYAVIFCGHFTENAESFTTDEIVGETKAQWYLRQLKGSSNLEGNNLFYTMTGHLSHQIEHHMFPDMPAKRYREVAPRLKEICAKYGQHYNTGSFVKQFASVWKRIIAYSFPDHIASKVMGKRKKFLEPTIVLSQPSFQVSLPSEEKSVTLT
ncbi:acyl-CoA desaturase [Leptospira biflexa]|uniref:fatty acid desaturase family protein n=1 Tax=Leptospira biflexa TaxID=172 RepID=UPI00108441D1|nr:acyl-CoA desaturase [Leptospira biflexa]TGM35782.1 acyl-CoA desaturase [Leptospira biflexa]TGM37152.1 acyl-CoA desaturase [Leptospira biflexa]TGM46692.1 acyl-CoA desaturase [Leptospira biflexa]TGM50843.1 acyl-CoA desaturase [Leptospira biflexa]TGM56115.1 acyl-CoA desaturase [Leptospira biflexa]